MFAFITAYPKMADDGPFSKTTVWTHGFAKVKQARQVEKRMRDSVRNENVSLEKGDVLSTNDFMHEVELIMPREL